MSIQFVLLPLFVEVVLTFGLLFWLAYRCGSATSRAAECVASDIALREPNWPPRAQQVANCFDNQFELPVLFYVLTILSIITHHADLMFVVLAWIFVSVAAGACLSCTSPATACSLRGADLRRRRAGAGHRCGSSSWFASCSACHEPAL